MSRVREQVLENQLIESAAGGDATGVKELIALGVNVNTQNSVNGWTPLHWACKRGYTHVVSELLKKGANKDILGLNGESPASVCSNLHILDLLAKSCSHSSGFQDEIEQSSGANANVVNIHKNPSSCSGHAQRVNPTSTEMPLSQDCLILKIRLANSKDPDFIEVEIPRRDLSYASVLQVCCNELNLQPQTIERLRKLPNTKLRNDADVQRMRNFQEIEVVPTNNEQICNGGPPVQTILTPANVYQSISEKDQTILY